MKHFVTHSSAGISFVMLPIIMVLLYGYCPAQKIRASDKYTVNKITIRGNKEISTHGIKRVMLIKERGWFSHTPFYNDLFEDDLKTIVQLYHNHGYLEASVEGRVNEADEQKRRVEILIEVSEGSITLIDSVGFVGNRVFSDDELKKLLTYRVGAPYNESMLEKSNYTLLAHYAQQGYIDAVIKPVLRLIKDDHLMTIIFEIQEGQKAYIEQIRVEGLDKIRPNVVLRELELKPGMVFDYSKLLESQHRIYQTGLFRTVSIRPVIIDSTDKSRRDLVVQVEEKKNGEVGFGIGFGSYERLRGSLEFSQNSLRGLSHQIGTRLRMSFKYQKFEFLYTNPWLLETRTKLDIKAFAEHTIEPNYELRGGGGRVTLGRSFSQADKMTMSYKYQDLLFDNVKDTTEIQDRSRGNTRSLMVNYIRDTRDSQFNTSQGTYVDVRWETAGGFLKGTNTFTKLRVEIRQFYKLIRSDNVILGMRCLTGAAQNFGASRRIPLNERFYVGGESSIRGFGRHKVGPETELGVPIGGKIIFLLNMELRYPIFRKFGGSIFYDAGNVWCCYDDTRYIKLRQGIGCGLRYNSPIGVVRMDVAIKLYRRPDEDVGEIYFTLGQIF